MYVCLNYQLIEVGNDFSRRQALLLILINSLCIVVYRNMSAFSINLPASLFSNIFQLGLSLRIGAATADRAPA